MEDLEVVPGVLAERARLCPDQLFVECAGEGRTFAEMQERAERVASGLHNLGVRKGDRVATILPNRIEHVELIFACARIGAIHVPVNVFLKGEFLRYQLADAAASVVVADADGLRAVGGVRGELGDLLHVVGCDDGGYGLLDGEKVPDVELAAGDTFAIVYTSGTTGMPKGCMLPHGYHVKSPEAGRGLLDYQEGDILYTALPLFHGWARGMVTAALVHSLTLVIDAEFSASSLLQRFAETHATVFSGVGAMGMALLATPVSDNDRAHDLRVAFMIPFSPDQQDAFTTRFGPRVQSQMYGQTETGAITFAPLAEEGKPATVGRASPQYEVRVVDDHDRDVAVGEPGEVIVRSKQPDTLYAGYWRKPDDTTEAIRGGWHHTGDMGRMDADGYLTFVDRKKDAIRRRGENVSSVQLEAAIVGHPAISEAAVVAVASEMTEDEIKACIVVAPDAAIEPSELFAFFRSKLPYFAIPRYVEIVEALPKTATMRVQKHLLRGAGVTEATWDLEQLGLTVARDERR
ncbi:MAG: AMP-binding protein [Actinomycetota bacterium]